MVGKVIKRVVYIGCTGLLAYTLMAWIMDGNDLLALWELACRWWVLEGSEWCLSAADRVE